MFFVFNYVSIAKQTSPFFIWNGRSGVSSGFHGQRQHPGAKQGERASLESRNITLNTLGKIANATPDVLEVGSVMVRFKLTLN